ncbi:sel1 repeat family protein [Enterobacter kobei]|nr:sel1 repeat family protein [Enterobacter kobei]QIP20615.1 sel1 repeat family protein [Enterobacter kobei]
MASLGYLYLNGLGVKKDLYKASKLYSDGCDKGSDEACKYLSEMKSNGLYRLHDETSVTKANSQRLIAKSLDNNVNATFTWQGDKAVFKANDGMVDCTFLKDFSGKDGVLATSFVCTSNVQIILKQFKKTKNAYIAVMTDNFKTEVNTFSVYVSVTK